jgi:uncharacterized protein YjiK
LIRILLAALLAVVPLTQEAAPSRSAVGCLSGKPVARWSLPPALREISGLAITADGRLLAHNDEYSRVVELDRETGKVVKAFRLGRNPIRGDFEAIVTAGPLLFLVTGGGVLHQAREGNDGVAVPFTTLATNASETCEVEGLSHDPSARALLLLCKTATRKSLRGTVTVLRFGLDQNRWLTPERITVVLDPEFRREIGANFRGSDLTRDPVTGNYLAIAGINKAVVEFSPDGRLLGRGRLGKQHSQAEGVAIAPDGTIYLSDEGVQSAGTVSVYACSR